MRYNILIIAILLGGMGIIGASIAVGVATRDVEVVDNAYEAGLKFDQVRKRTEELGWKVELPRSLSKGEGGLELTAVDRSGAALSDAQVTLRTFKLGTRAVQTYQCANRGGGRYAATVRFDSAGAWSAQVQVALKGDSVLFENTISVQ